LYDEHVALGARMVPFAGWEMPVQYAGIVEEHKAVRSSAGIFDASHMAEFRIFGVDAFEGVQRLFTNDLAKLDEVGRGQYTLMCADDGGILDDLIVYRTGDAEYMVVANASNRDKDRDWISGHLPKSVEFADESDRTALIALQGPEAVRIVAEMGDGSQVELPRRFRIGEANLAGVPVLIARTGYTGEDGVELFCAAQQAAQLWRALLSFPEVTPCGLGARDTLRLEMGYPLYGSDMDETTDPISAGLGWVVSLQKGSFTGSGPIAEKASSGADRKLVGLTVSEGIPRHGYPVLHEGKEVGKVASGTFSPTLGHGIATAYLPASLAEEGTRVEIGIRKKVVAAAVARPPFVKDTSLAAK
jgi:aminomethyltransferase